jgi:hypothetical protein
LAIINHAAVDNSDLFIDSCTGNPTATVTWQVREDFSAEPQRANSVLNQRQTSGIVGALDSGVRGALAKTARGPAVQFGAALYAMMLRCGYPATGCRLWFFTSGAWKDVVSPGTMTSSDLQRYIAANAGGLRDLRGATVTFLGLGLAAHLTPAALRREEQLATRLVAAVGASTVFGDPEQPPGA